MAWIKELLHADRELKNEYISLRVKVANNETVFIIKCKMSWRSTPYRGLCNNCLKASLHHYKQHVTY